MPKWSMAPPTCTELPGGGVRTLLAVQRVALRRRGSHVGRHSHRAIACGQTPNGDKLLDVSTCRRYSPCDVSDHHIDENTEAR